MKKTSTLAIIFCLLVVFLPAKTSQGIKLGLNVSSFGGEDYRHYESKIGFSLGAFINVELNQYLAFQPEAIYTTKGGSDTMKNSAVLIEDEYSSGYLEIPFLLKLKLPTNSNFEPTYFIGPFIGMNLKTHNDCYIEVYKEDGSIDFDFTIDEDISYGKSTEYGLIVGAGMNYNKISFEARYSMGFSEIFDLDNSEAKNKVVSFIIGHEF